jgi:hypothetical protein
MGMTLSRLRWLPLGIGVIAFWACNDRKVQVPVPMPTGATTNYFEQNVNNDIDIVFAIDDSSSMTTVQNVLVANFPVFINVLKSLPNGLPNVHIAVVSQDMGAGAFTSSVPGCTTPDLGEFIYQVRAATNPVCATARITDGKHFIESLNNGSQTNFSGDITDVFSCIAQLGANGCGFEHQLEGVRAALGDSMSNDALHIPARSVPPGNMGFLRDDAFLAVIWITNEDDCSAPPDSQLFDPNQTTVQDPLGPLASFRCTEFGILCNGQKPPRMPAGPLANCVSDDMLAQTDPLRSLIPMSYYIDYFRRVKGNPNRVILAAVAAPTDPFAVVLDTNMYPALQHSCQSGNGTFGDPGVRLKQLIDSAGDLGTYTSICQDSYADAMQVIAQKIGQRLGRQCVDGVLAKLPDFTQPEPKPAAGQVVNPADISCTVEDVQYSGTPMQKTLRSLPPCNPAGQPSGACWALIGDDSCSLSGARIAVCRNGFVPSNPMSPCPMGGSLEDGVTAVVSCATIP